MRKGPCPGRNMNSQTVTHRDLARELGVSETTIKSYRGKFPTFLPIAREGKPVRLHAEALPVCRRIRDLFAEGLSIVQIIKLLRTEFKEYPLNRRLPILSKQRAEPTIGAAMAPLGETERQTLAEYIEALTRGQEQARRRMEQLEAEVRNLATMEAASKALVAELVQELRAARAAAAASVLPRPDAARQHQAPFLREDVGLASPVSQERGPNTATPAEFAEAPTAIAAEAEAGEVAGANAAPSMAAPTVVTAQKIVTVHSTNGPVASYAFAREPAPSPPFPEPETPGAAFLSLPAVIRSDRGDFLGLPGGQSVRRLVEVLAPEGFVGTTGAPGVAWFSEGPDAWTCAIPLGRAQKREILFERTTTPRGNLVGLIRHMRINEAEATPTQLQEIFRQLRDQMA